MKIAIPLYLIAIGIIVIALQNSGVIPPWKIPEVQVRGTVKVWGSQPKRGLSGM